MLLKGKEVAYLGILLALNLIFIVLASVIKTNTLVLFAIAALVVSIVVVEFGVKRGVLFYVASCIMGYFLTFDKIEIISYILFFGLYSIVKYLIEKVSMEKKLNIVVEFVLKYVFFNIVAIILYFLLREFILIKALWILIVAAEVGFIVYDYAFTGFINFYIFKIKPKIKK